MSRARGGDAAPTEWRWMRRELRPFLGPQMISAGCLVAATILSLCDPLILRWLIDSGLRRMQWRATAVAVALFCILLLARAMLSFAGGLIASRVLLLTILRVRRRLLRTILRRDSGFHERFPVGDLMYRLEQDVDQFAQVGSELLPASVRIVTAASVSLVVMAWLDPRLTGVVLVFAALLLTIRRRFLKTLERLSDDSRQRHGARSSILNESLQAVDQIQALTAELFVGRKYYGIAAGATRSSYSQRQVELAYGAATVAIMTAAGGVVLFAGAAEIGWGTLTVGGFVAFYSYLMRLFDPLSAAVDVHARIKRAGGSIKRIAAVETAEQHRADSGRAMRCPDIVLEVKCSNVSFARTGQRSILRGVTLGLRRGEKVALVGQSGSGKSTLAKIIVGFHAPTDGNVTIDDRDLATVRTRLWRSRAGLVPSSPAVFSASARDNVLMGASAVPDVVLDRLAVLACFDSVLSQWPEGWDASLGRGGINLSDGERQRLGILRALVRDHSMLVFDEATSALDPELESKVLANLRQVTRDKCVLIITHRPSAARWADRVVVLRDGQLHELDSTDLHAFDSSPWHSTLAEESSMTTSSGRRAGWLALARSTSSLALGAVLSVGPLSRPAASAQSPLVQAASARELAPGLVLVSSRDANLLIRIGAKRSEVIGIHAPSVVSRARQVLDSLRAPPVDYAVVMTTDSAYAFGDGGWGARGAAVIAHENLRYDRHYREFVAAVAGPSDIPRNPFPPLGFSDVMQILVPGEDEIHVVHQAPGFSNADVIAHIERANIIMLGNLYASDGYPEVTRLFGGSIDGMIKTLGFFNGGFQKSIIVPGRGPAQNHAEFSAYVAMLTTVRDTVKALVSHRMSRDAVVALRPTRVFDARWGNGPISPAAFVESIYDSIVSEGAADPRPPH